MMNEKQRIFIFLHHEQFNAKDLAKEVGESEHSVRNHCWYKKYKLKPEGSPHPGIFFKEKVKAVYTNSRSPYGIADELHGYNLK